MASDKRADGNRTDKPKGVKDLPSKAVEGKKAEQVKGGVIASDFLIVKTTDKGSTSL